MSAANWRFSSLNAWTTPSLYAILYLSSSNTSKNLSVSVNVTVPLLEATLKVACDLTWTSEPLKSTLDMESTGKSEIRVEFCALINLGLTILKSLVTRVEPLGNSFWQTPDTSTATCAIVIVAPEAATAVTLLYVGSDSPAFWYFTISPILTPLLNLLPPTLTVPPVVIEYSVPAGAGLPSLERTVSALNSLSPTSWKMDLTSSIECSVTVVIVLLSTTPFTLIGSSTINVPLVSCKIREVAPLAAETRYPLAPLLWPSINDPRTAVRPLFTVRVVYIDISHKRTSYTLESPVYLAASNL